MTDDKRMHDPRAAHRNGFFNYFRGRLKTAARDDVPLPDRLFLLAATLDVLAKHWQDAVALQPMPGNERMRAFLLRHGNHPAFQKVSAPMFRNAEGEEIGQFPFHEYKPFTMNRVRDWTDDPDFDDLVATGLDRQQLLRWSYPGILYIDFRCAWVHNFVPENDDIDIRDADFLGRGEPYYRYLNSTSTRRGDRFLFMIPLPFLLSTVDRALTSFEAEAGERDLTPLTRS